MKTKTLLLAGLSALALTSCGLKKYENEVSKDKFTQRLHEVLEKSSLTSKEGKDYIFSFESFEFKLEKEYKLVDKYYKDDKKIAKTRNEGSSTQKIKFDKSKSICKIEVEGEDEYESESVETSEDVDSTKVYQSDNQYVYYIDVDHKTYESYKENNPSKEVAEKAFKTPNACLNNFLEKVENGSSDNGDKYYIDDNVFTYVENLKKEDEKVSKIGQDVYQLVIEDDKIKYCEELDLEINEQNLKTKDKSSESWTFEKSDVSLKSVNTDKYLNTYAGDNTK